MFLFSCFMAIETLLCKELGEQKPLQILPIYSPGPGLALLAIPCGLLVKAFKKVRGFGINLLNEGLVHLVTFVLLC